jgi:hypothetical protein
VSDVAASVALEEQRAVGGGNAEEQIVGGWVDGDVEGLGGAMM